MKEKKAAAQEALLDRIAEIAPSANASSVKDLAEAYAIVSLGDMSKDRKAGVVY